jgi:hypothetical protein
MELQHRIEDLNQVKGSNPTTPSEYVHDAQSMVPAKELSAEAIIINNRKKAVCTTLNELFELINDATCAAESTSKGELLQQLQLFNSSTGGSDSSVCVDRRFLISFYADDVSMTEDVLSDIIVSLEAENRIFVDGNEIYQI